MTLTCENINIYNQTLRGGIILYNTQQEYKVYPYRWINYFVYLFVCISAAAGFSSKSTLLSTMAQRWDTALGTVALLITVFTIWQVLLSLPSGILVSRIGFKPVIITGISFVILGLYLRSTVDAFMPFLYFTIIAGFGWGLILGPMGKIVANWFPLHERGQANSYFPAGINAGMALGSLTSVYFTTTLGWNMGWRIYSFIALFVAIVALFALKEKPPLPPNPQVNASKIKIGKGIRQVMTCFTIPMQYTALATIGAIVITPGLVYPVLYNGGVAPNIAGLISGFSLAGGVIGTLIIPTRAFRGKKVRSTMLKCSILSPLLFISIFYLPSSPQTAWMIALTAFFFGFFNVPVLGMALGFCMIQEEITPANASILSGLFLTSIGIGSATIPLLVAKVIDSSGGLFTAGAWVQVILLLISLAVIYIHVREQK
ncbi:MAG: MFS transporter [Bacillota bacterium]|nr:MFS transporter [Bacillota bacterium]